MPPPTKYASKICAMYMCSASQRPAELCGVKYRICLSNQLDICPMHCSQDIKVPILQVEVEFGVLPVAVVVEYMISMNVDRTAVLNQHSAVHRVCVSLVYR